MTLVTDDTVIWMMRYWKLAEEMRAADWMLLVADEPKFLKWYEEAHAKFNAPEVDESQQAAR